mgnify:CR=1 FL=1
MASSAEELILSVGAELGRTPEQLKGIIDTVIVDNWYEEASSLANITDAQWAAVRAALPRPLVEATKRHTVRVHERIHVCANNGPRLRLLRV